MSNNYWLELLLFVTFIVYASIVFISKKGKSDIFDERQKVVRGDAYKHTLMVAFAALFLGGYLSRDLEPFVESGVLFQLLLAVLIAVFMVECIVRDALFAPKKEPYSLSTCLVWGCASLVLGGVLVWLAIGGVEEKRLIIRNAQEYALTHPEKVIPVEYPLGQSWGLAILAESTCVLPGIVYTLRRLVQEARDRA